MLNNKSIQQDAALHVVRIAQTALGTEVNAGRVQLVYPFGITIDDLTIYDLKHDTLAHIASVSVRFDPKQLIRHKVSISSVRLNSPDIRLNRDSVGSGPNYAFLLAHAGDSDSDSDDNETEEAEETEETKMSFRANSVLIRNGVIRYDVKSEERIDSIFDTRHIAVSGLIANLSVKSISTDSVSVILRKFAFAEQSGFRLVKSNGAVKIGKSGSDLSGLSFSLPESSVEFERLISSVGLDTLSSPIPQASVRVKASLTGSDLKAFIPQTSGMTDRIDLTLNLNTGNGLVSVSSLNVTTPGKEFALNGHGTVVLDQEMKISEIRNTKIEGAFTDSLSRWADTQLAGFSFSTPDKFRYLGNGSFSATLEHSQERLDANVSLISDAGTAQCTATGADGKYNAKLSSYDLLLSPFTGNRDLGKCILYAEMNLNKEPDGWSGDYDGNIGSIVYKRYRYRNIAFKGNIAPNRYFADIKFSDKNGSIAMEAAVNTAPYNALSLNLDVDSINLYAYHLAGTENMSLTTDVTARMIGSSIDDIIGRITVDSLLYSDGTGSWSMDNLTANIGTFNDAYRVISVYSDFMNVSMVGLYRLSTLGGSISKACQDIMPTVGNIVASKTGRYDKRKPNFFVVEGRIDNLDFMESVFHMPISLDSPSDIHLTINDEGSKCSGSINIPGIRYNGKHISDGLLAVETSNGKGQAQLAGKYGEKETGLASLSTSFQISDDNIDGQYSWSNQNGDISGTAHSATRLLGYNKRNGLNSSTIISPTSVIINGINWDIDETEIGTNKRKIYISGFNASNNEQYLSADGTVSPDSSDILTVSMKRIDLDHTLSTFNANVAQIKGIASGTISIAGVTGDPAADGSFDIDGFEFFNSYQGDIHADCRWTKQSERVEVKATADDADLAHTIIDGYYQPGNKFIDINIGADNTDLHFLNKWTSTVFKDIGGKAIGNLRIFGSLPKLDMEGEAILQDGYFVQDAIHTTFLVKRDTLWFEPGKMLFRDVEFYDEKGHDGLLTCILSHDHFSKWTVDMNADVANMLVYNHPRTDQGDIFASVYAEGSMKLTFDERNGLVINVDARTAPGTRIGYKPSAGTVADYNFLTIVDRNSVKIDEKTVRDIIPDKTKSKKNFNLDFDIECSEDALIEMSMASLNGFFRGNGKISLKYNPQDGPILNGLYNLSYGQCSLSLEDVIRKNFTLADGSYVRFNGAPLDTELNLITYHNVNSASIYDLDPSMSPNNKVRVRCLLGISGNVTEPKLTFDIDMPTGTSEERDILASDTSTEEQRNIQFMYLLAIGRFYAYDVNSAQNDGLTPSAMESIVNSTVSGQINNLLSQVMDNEKVSISSNVSASSYLTNDETNLSNKELEGILEAHLLNNRLLVNGNFGYRENTINNTSNFIGDFEVKYLLLPRQGISIKGYNKSNDKYFSKTTLTTQGVGLVFERDF